MWRNNPWHQVHLRLSPWLSCFPIKHGECLQFGVKQGHISKTLCSKWRHHTTCPLCSYILCIWISLFYNHHNCDGDVIVIPSTMGTHQGDTLGEALFALAHLRALSSITSHFPSYLFPSIMDDIHIITSIPLYPLHINTFRLNFKR
jgi:hypothetical protein